MGDGLSVFQRAGFENITNTSFYLKHFTLSSSALFSLLPFIVFTFTTPPSLAWVQSYRMSSSTEQSVILSSQEEHCFLITTNIPLFGFFQ
jgi:hypothetical protein